MNYLVTFSDHDFEIDEGKIHSDENETNGFDLFTLEFLKSYWRNDNVDDIKKLVQQSQHDVSIENLFRELDDYAAKYFNVEPSLQLKFRENTIGISQCKDVVYMNTTMSSAFWSYIATQIYHSHVLDLYGPDSDEDLFCYKYTLFILNDICFNEFKQPVIFPCEESAGLLLSKMADMPNLLDVSSDIFYSAIAFALLHEISHAYLKHDEKTVGLDKEIEADENAYLIYLNFCYDVQYNKINSKFKECLTSYMYLAPLCLLDFYYVVFFTGSYLCTYHSRVKQQSFDNIVARKDALFEVFYSWDCNVDPNESYDMYNIYLDSVESFIRSFVASDKAGMLDIVKERNDDRHHD